jgi:hypothetical protein
MRERLPLGAATAQWVAPIGAARVIAWRYHVAGLQFHPRLAGRFAGRPANARREAMLDARSMTSLLDLAA